MKNMCHKECIIFISILNMYPNVVEPSSFQQSSLQPITEFNETLLTNSSVKAEINKFYSLFWLNHLLQIHCDIKIDSVIVNHL